jgi:phage FluMu protein Com
MNLKIKCPKCKVLSNYLLENEEAETAILSNEIVELNTVCSNQKCKNDFYIYLQIEVNTFQNKAGFNNVTKKQIK